MAKDPFIPSMFHRRLILLLGGCAIIVVILGLQMGRLSIVEGAQRLAFAEASLDRTSYLPTYRGRILDRQGKVLARDRASYDLAVFYDVITGAWSQKQARTAARKDVGVNAWFELGELERLHLIEARLPEYEAEISRLWQEIVATGLITEAELQEKRDDIKSRVQRMAASIWENQHERAQASAGEDETIPFDPRPIHEQTAAHIILEEIPDALAFEFRRLALEHDDMVEVRDAHSREYPWTDFNVYVDRMFLPGPLASDQPLNIRVTGVADHILGEVRDGARAEDIKRRPFYNPRTRETDLGGYRAQRDIVGLRGLELAYEDQLRGSFGTLTRHLDDDTEERTNPVPGVDVQTTLDIMLQARIQATLSPDLGLTRVQPWHQNPGLPLGTALNSAAVVIEIESGEVLAAVSLPTRAMAAAMSDDEINLHQPWTNRATEAVYPPGSIIKPLVLCAAVKDGRHALNTPIECTGYFFEGNPHVARCWIYRERWDMRTHGELEAAEALARSCNIFFQSLAQKVGMESLMSWYGRFGLGTYPQIGLAATVQQVNSAGEPITRTIGETRGYVPDSEAIAKMRQQPGFEFSQAIAGIGQGAVTWTPMQAAQSYAILARGGEQRTATIIAPEFSAPDIRTSTADIKTADLDLPRGLVTTALDGLRQSVSEAHGTGYAIRFPDPNDPEAAPDVETIINAQAVTVWAKTGTAQAPPIKHWGAFLPHLDTNGNGLLDKGDDAIKGLEHSWFVGLVGPRDTNLPLYAIAVIVEYGGSGGRVAGPIANQVIRALQAEGYLPG